MRKVSKLLMALGLSLAMSQCFAIQVNVQATGSNIAGLGFTVNGSKHGGAGNSYQGDGMPKGSYTFGLRSRGRNVGCTSSDGKKRFKITQNSTAVMQFDGRHCTVNVSSD